MAKKNECMKNGFTKKGAYEAPAGVSLGKGSVRVDDEGCKHGNQIQGDCTTGGHPGGSPADCKNGAHADDPASGACENGSNPS